MTMIDMVMPAVIGSRPATVWETGTVIRFQSIWECLTRMDRLVGALGVVIALAGGILLALMRLRKLQKRGMLGTVHGELR
jgi:hypothetical protein